MRGAALQFSSRRKVPAALRRSRATIDAEVGMLRHMLEVLRTAPGLTARQRTFEIEGRLVQLRAELRGLVVTVQRRCTTCGWTWTPSETTGSGLDRRLRCPGCKAVQAV